MINGMKVLKLGKIGQFSNGANFTPKQLGYGTKFVNLDDIYRAKNLKSSDNFERVSIENTEKFLLDDGDILFVRSSVKPSGVGYPSLFVKDSVEPVIYCGFIIRYRFDQKLVNPKYLLYQLFLPINRNKVISRGQVVANTNINQKGLGSLSINIHSSIDEQNAISKILTKVDDVIDAVEESIKATRKLKKSLMQNLLSGKLKPDGTWRAEDEFYTDEKLGKVPMGWKMTSVGSLTDRKAISFNPKNTSTIKNYVGLEHVEPSSFIRVGFGSSDQTLSLKNEFSIGDVLLGKLRPYLNKVWIADIDGVCSTEFLVFPKSDVSDWLYLSFQSKRFLDYTTSVTAGTQHPRASWRDVKRYKVLIPLDINEQTQIESLVLNTEKEMNEQRSKLLTLEKLKKSLMHDLLTGTKRVNADRVNKILEVN